MIRAIETGLATLEPCDLVRLIKAAQAALSRKIMENEKVLEEIATDQPPRERPALEIDMALCSVLGRETQCPYCMADGKSSRLVYFIATLHQREDGRMGEAHHYRCSNEHGWGAMVP